MRGGSSVNNDAFPNTALSAMAASLLEGVAAKYRHTNAQYSETCATMLRESAKPAFTCNMPLSHTPAHSHAM